MNRNRTAGHNYERLIVNKLKEMGFDAVTTRSESRNLDNLGIDVISNTFPHDLQCKITKSLNSKGISLLLDRGRENKPLVIIHRIVEKANSKFISKGDYVYLKLEDYFNLINNGKEK